GGRQIVAGREGLYSALGGGVHRRNGSVTPASFGGGGPMGSCVPSASRHWLAANVPHTPYWLQQPHTGPVRPRKLGHSPVIDGSSGGVVAGGLPPPASVTGAGGAKHTPMLSRSTPQSPFGRQQVRSPSARWGHCERSHVAAGGGAE